MQGVFFLHHMKRSGGHAIINWLLDNFPGAGFVNNDLPIQPILSARRSLPTSLPLFADWLEWKRQRDQLAGNTIDPSPLLVSLEDHQLWVRPFTHPEARRIVIVRDPRNLFASRIRRASDSNLLAFRRDHPQMRARAIRIWQEHARAALSGVDRGQPVTAIYYDAWLIGDGYRMSVAAQLGIADPLPPSGRVASEGRGSSFGQMQINPAHLLNRANFLNDAEKAALVGIMAEPETAELADQIASEIARLSVLP